MFSKRYFFNIPVFSRRSSIIILLFGSILSSSQIIASGFASGEPKRIEVYSLSQHYWDVQNGDTLSNIAHHLLPNNPVKREALQQDILQQNLGAFTNGNPEKLLAGKRLWLPGYMKQADSRADPSTTTVEVYSWGNIKRSK